MWENIATSKVLGAVERTVFLLVNLKKVFDQRMCAPEYLVTGGMSLYKGCKTAFSVEMELSDYFSVRFAAPQGSALTLLNDPLPFRSCCAFHLFHLSLCSDTHLDIE